MLLFILGWLIGWGVLVAALVAFSFFQARRERIEKEVRGEIDKAMIARGEELSRRTAAMMEQIKKDPVAFQVFKTLEGSAERLIKRQGVTIQYPPGLPPDCFVAVIRAIAENLDRHLRQSEVMHDELKTKDTP